MLVNVCCAVAMSARPVLAHVSSHQTRTVILKLAENGDADVKKHAITVVGSVHADARGFGGLRKSALAGATTQVRPSAPEYGSPPLAVTAKADLAVSFSRT
jgi:hypothetical protein